MKIKLYKLLRKCFGVHVASTIMGFYLADSDYALYTTKFFTTKEKK